MNQTRHQQRLASLPELFRQLMQAPLQPLTQGRLPVSGATYVFYLGAEAIRVGSPPGLDEIRLLASSVRLGWVVQAGPDMRIQDCPAQSAPDKILHARWLTLDDDEDRRLLELYAAQSLGTSLEYRRDWDRPRQTA